MIIEERKTIVSAKKKARNYQLAERFIAGIVLKGQEIKSIRNNQISIDESYISVQNQELYITNMHISLYKYSSSFNFKEKGLTKRKRKLLLGKRELNKLIQKIKIKNFVLVPLTVFLSKNG